MVETSNGYNFKINQAMVNDEENLNYICEDLKNLHADAEMISTLLENDNDSIKDPYCDPDHPVKIAFEDITCAAFKIKHGVLCTPCIRSHVSSLIDMEIYLKQDFLQYTGSFKERGARYALLMLSDEKKKIGVIGASLGNHAQALSYHGYKLGIPVTVVMPVTSPIMKIAKCRKYHANVVVEGADMADSRRIALRLAKDKGYTYINGFDHPHVIAGQGTLALEVMEQVKDIDAIIVPVGGGSLISGTAIAYKTLHPKVQIIGVESVKCASYSQALKEGKPVYTKIESTLADGLAVNTVGYNAFAISSKLIDRMVQVSEDWIAISILRLAELEKCVVEGAGACGLAAILSGQLPELMGKKVVLVLSGGNIDSTILGRCLERGLAADGRLIKFKVQVSDRPGGISELCRLISSIGVSIKDILHERAWVHTDVFSVEVKAVCETRDYDHALELKELLTKTYKQVHFGDFPPAASSKLKLPLV